MILLDTHAWVWFASAPRKLSARARRAIDEAERIGVSPISCWEVATLVRRGRLKLDREVDRWVDQALALPRVELVPISPGIAVSAGLLARTFHGDPADRLIVATALAAGERVVTRDALIRDSGVVRCIW